MFYGGRESPLRHERLRGTYVHTCDATLWLLSDPAMSFQHLEGRKGKGLALSYPASSSERQGIPGFWSLLFQDRNDRRPESSSPSSNQSHPWYNHSMGGPA